MAVTVTDEGGIAAVGTSSGGVAVTAPIGAVVVAFVATGGDTTVNISDNRSHSYTAGTKRVVPSGTVSTMTAFWTTVATANPTVTAGRSTSGQIAMYVYVLDGATVTGISEAGNAAAGATSLAIGSVSGTGIALAGTVVSSVSAGNIVSVSPSFTRDSNQTMGSVSRVMETFSRSGGSLTVSASWSSTRTSAGVALIIPEASAPPAYELVKLWDGSSVDPYEVHGIVESGTLVPVNVMGHSTGSVLEPVETT